MTQEAGRTTASGQPSSYPKKGNDARVPEGPSLLATALYFFVDELGLGELLPGPIDVPFAEGDYLEPDLISSP